MRNLMRRRHLLFVPTLNRHQANSLQCIAAFILNCRWSSRQTWALNITTLQFSMVTKTTATLLVLLRPWPLVQACHRRHHLLKYIRLFYHQQLELDWVHRIQQFHSILSLNLHQLPAILITLLRRVRMSHGQAGGQVLTGSKLGIGSRSIILPTSILI